MKTILIYYIFIFEFSYSKAYKSLSHLQEEGAETKKKKKKKKRAGFGLFGGCDSLGLPHNMSFSYKIVLKHRKGNILKVL
jgi:hypothetical protein